MKAIDIPCPKCQSSVKATKSHRLSSTIKEITYLCQNPDCCHVFVALLKMSRTLTFTLTIPSPPNPDVSADGDIKDVSIDDVSIEVSHHVRQCTAVYATNQCATSP